MQPRSLCQTEFLKQPLLPAWGLRRNPLTKESESSQAMLKEENSCYSNQLSTCTESAPSSLLIFSGFISSGRETACRLRAVLGSAGWRVAWKAPGGPHPSGGPCLLEDVLHEGCHCFPVVTEPPKLQRNRLFASFLAPGSRRSPAAILSESRLVTGPLHILCSLTGTDFSLLVEEETGYRLFSMIARFCNSS